MNEPMMKKLADQLIDHEGERLKPYLCTAGKLTIGIGRNLDDKGISQAESRILLVNDIAECKSDLQMLFSMWESFSPVRQIALIDLRFNLGAGGFRSFRRMIAAIRRGDWQGAGKEAMDSRWAVQVQKSRSGRIYAQLVGG